MKNSFTRRNYNKLKKLGFLEIKDHETLKSEGFMDLSIEIILIEQDYLHLSLAHYGEQNGDLMADPEMIVRVYPSKEIAEALGYRNDYTGLYQSILNEDENGIEAKDLSLAHDLNKFLALWLRNIEIQGFKYSKE